MDRVITAEEFEELYRATARDVFGYARRRHAGDVEDLVAEVYVVAWRRRADLPGPSLRRAWLFGVARTLLKAEGRRRRSEAELVGELAAQSAPTAAAQAASPGSERTTAVVVAAVSRLSVRDREILQLVGWEGLTPAELAVTLGIRPGTARVRLHRARQALAADQDVQTLVERPGSVLLQVRDADSSPTGGRAGRMA
ncbi:RNA polymerase sigma factor [Nocardioides pacificus]